MIFNFLRPRSPPPIRELVGGLNFEATLSAIIMFQTDGQREYMKRQSGNSPAGATFIWKEMAFL
jgi:hypothetical protein